MGFGYIVACSRPSVCEGEGTGNEACARTRGISGRPLQAPSSFPIVLELTRVYRGLLVTNRPGKTSTNYNVH